MIKAWCAALALGDTAYPYTLDNTPWSCIEILDDSHGCPRVQLAQKVQDKLCASLSLKLAEPSNNTELAELSNTAELAGLANIPNTSGNICNAIHWHISLTHDGSVQNNTAVASAVAMLEIL